MIIDSHCHIHDEQFAGDLSQVLERARLSNVSHLITIGCDIPTTKRAKDLAQKLANVYFTAGFHPHDAKSLSASSLLELKDLAKDQKCVAIGEIGLDYFYMHSEKAVQLLAFEQQLSLALELNLPVVIHLRDAFDDCVNILNGYQNLLKQRTVIHCFSGTLSEAQVLERLGCFISLSGILTFKKSGELTEVAKSISLDRLLVETDCPYLAPQPFRGKRNEPSYIVYTLAAIAEARHEPLPAVREQIFNNTKTFFRLPT
ncbi:MAG TPA: TatD family hydrolase [Myxococcota bacterium]|nr:TatD family hydrolase [Myxococcota bacterium]